MEHVVYEEDSGVLHVRMKEDAPRFNTEVVSEGVFFNYDVIRARIQRTVHQKQSSSDRVESIQSLECIRPYNYIRLRNTYDS